MIRYYIWDLYHDKGYHTLDLKISMGDQLRLYPKIQNYRLENQDTFYQCLKLD